MYIDPFIAGFMTAIIIEGAAILVYAIYYAVKKGDDDEED